MIYLGLDLGTGFARLARAQAGAPSLAKGTAALTMVPTAVIYRGLASEIPAHGADEVLPPGAVRCDGFPAMLDAALSASRVAAWRSRTPGEVTQGFLRCLLDALDGAPRPAGSGEEPAELVVAVPPAGRNQRGAGHGQSMGTEVRDILTALGQAPRRLVAAPVAALLQLRHDDADLAAATRYVVFDGGAGSVELSLCTADGQGIRVADSIRLIGMSAWGEDTLAFADDSDRSPTLAECLAAALAAATGTRTAPTGPASVFQWRALERALAEDGQRDRLDVVLQQASAARHRHGGTVALRFAGLEVTAAQLLDACEPLAQLSAAALSRLLGRQADPGWLRFGTGNATRLVLTGGLSALRPLRTALMTAAGLDPDMPGSSVIQPGNADRIGAAARGAALIAAGQADPGDRYPHALRLAINRMVRDRIVPAYLELAAPDSIDLDLAQTVFLTEENEPVLVTVRPAAGPPGSAPIPVQIVPRGGIRAVPATFHPAAPPEPGVYRVGVRGGPDGPAVVLQHTDGGEALTYSLAEPADLAWDSSPGQAAR